MRLCCEVLPRQEAGGEGEGGCKQATGAGATLLCSPWPAPDTLLAHSSSCPHPHPCTHTHPNPLLQLPLCPLDEGTCTGSPATGQTCRCNGSTSSGNYLCDVSDGVCKVGCSPWLLFCITCKGPTSSGSYVCGVS